MQEVFIVSAVRTPIGSFGGGLAPLSAVELGARAIRAAILASGLEPGQIDEVIMGNVISAGLGQAPARQAALGAGLPASVVCTTVNKVCASGTKALMFAAQAIMCGQANVVVAGGMESMSNIPFYVPKARFGYKFGNAELVDGLVRDGLEDVYDKKAMGVYADATAAKYHISRQAQDEYAIESYKRAAAASGGGKFAAEIVPVEVPSRKGSIIISQDEEYKNVQFDKIAGLKPAFTTDGSATAANSSTINDGAAALVLVSGEQLRLHNLRPIARIVAFADAAQSPQWFTTSPTIAVPKALEKAGLSSSQISYFEINEAFSVVALAFNQILGLDAARVNVHGGAVALGHPLGCSGARIAVSLAHILQSDASSKYGALGICNGGGGASAMILERV